LSLQKSFTEQNVDKGTLFLVATPIGNLQDMTFRAIDILKQVDCIAAEDTRQTIKLMNHFEITSRLVSYHEHNKEASGAELIRWLLVGKSIALVSDAGTPVISDPGQDLVQAALEQDIPVVPIPGANAAINALIASGLDTNSFSFIGFLPRNKKPLDQKLGELAQHKETMIFYESPYRVEKTLERMLEQWGNRRASVVRELTKRYETWFRGDIQSCLKYVKEEGTKGEYCLVVEGATIETILDGANEAWWKDISIREHVEAYIKKEGLSSKEAIKQTAADRQCSKREVYQAYHIED
jgi:16S rRNA (cytidine1402-2'-O)-methyltransferase